jgi:predicted Zn finger-like uncharacterized protein
VKFLCDRCKTRYSIGDERVRGKILKIRCKNCANVITVREGMPDIDAADPQGARHRNPTQAVPLVTAGAAMGNVLPNAFAAASPKPPAALEEEWYVSLDGEQEGPFSLADAQRWVSKKAINADLHCWSEGFDDWLPVDKVSHFRGLRKRPTTPPPLPAKPLFAATMASIEKAVPKSTPAARAAQLPRSSPIAPPKPSSGRAVVPPARSNGAHAPAFDSLDAATQIQSPSFEDVGASSTADPFANTLAVDAKTAAATTSALMAAAAPIGGVDAAPEDDDDLSIGEVSRVVNLSDLRPPDAYAAPRRANPSTNAPFGRTGSVPKLSPAGFGRTGAVPKLAGTAQVPRIDDPNLLAAAGMGESASDLSATSTPVAAHHRRGLIMLMGVAGLLLASVVIVVVLLVQNNDHSTDGYLGRGSTIDTTRPDDPLRKPEATAPPNPFFPSKPNPRRGNSNPGPDRGTPVVAPTGNTLRSEEIEEMAAKYSMSTQRCYMRSQKGADAILIGDVKKIMVTLNISPDGTVSDVQLSQHAANNLGRCLISSIKTWKFRPSPGGLYKFSLQFVSG